MKYPVMLSRFILPALFIFAFAVPAFADVESLLSQSCLECHDDAVAKGDLSLETLDLAISDSNAGIWEKALEQVERGFMPPAGEAQPTAEEREAAIVDLENRLVSYHEQKPREETQSVLRRLNRTEYRNTIRDLFGLELGSDPTSAFPGDERSHGFATNGETLVTSNFLLRQYLEAAEEIVGRAIHFEPKPEMARWELRAPFDRTTSEQAAVVRYHDKTGESQSYQDFNQRIGAGGAPYRFYHPIDEMSGGVPVSGWYDVRIDAEGKFRHLLDEGRFKRWPSLWDPSEPIRLALFTASLEGIDPQNREGIKFAKVTEQAGQKHLATWDLPDDEVTSFECRVWLEAGQFLRIGFPNGPTNSNNRILKYFDEVAADNGLEDEHEERKKLYGGLVPFHFGETPRIRVHSIDIEGPVNETWPPASHRVVFGNTEYQSADAAEVLQSFATRAWRRPVDATEVGSALKLVRAAEGDGIAPEAAIQEGLKAILCSPGFIYREERGAELTNEEIASRLSYFLWASMPDEALMKRAAAGELKAGNLRAEAERILSDPRSDSFVNEFLDGWLQLSRLGSMAPDPFRYRIYYDDRLEPAMRTETRLFFRHLLDSNGPISDFLDSDYTFVNKELAGFYQVEDGSSQPTDLDPRHLRQDGLGSSPTTLFTRVGLTDPRRGGLLGQASVLTLTANGVDTSPVIRGIWLLENILGTPPSPPPPGIPAIEPDIRGAKTIRDQLEKHRESASCRSCHAHIDPPGFALESFDPIGKWRGHYRVGKGHIPVDPSGTFGGEAFEDVVAFKAGLMKREKAFARCLVEKLFIHALGRELVITDRPHIRNILDATEADHYPLRDLVLAVIESEIFSLK
ncbi:MAG: DUF1592 domain-containing protein [Verrucomicrobiales bacterium]|nr:DUF1592 domain-containing protein [Verrucomicrobiales bacterium]